MKFSSEIGVHVIHFIKKYGNSLHSIYKNNGTYLIISISYPTKMRQAVLVYLVRIVRKVSWFEQLFFITFKNNIRLLGFFNFKLHSKTVYKTVRSIFICLRLWTLSFLKMVSTFGRERNAGNLIIVILLDIYLGVNYIYWQHEQYRAVSLILEMQ